jgi:hypothetical protein
VKNPLLIFGQFNIESLIHYHIVQKNKKKYFVVINQYLITGIVMGKKIIGMLVIGLVFSLILPAASSFTPQKGENTNTTGLTKPASQLEITIKGGLGVHVFIKNIGTTDVHVSEMKLNLDGAKIIYNTDSGDLDIKAGKTKQVIYVVTGFGATNIEVTLDTITQITSGKILFCFVYGVE